MIYNEPTPATNGHRKRRPQWLTKWKVGISFFFFTKTFSHKKNTSSIMYLRHLTHTRSTQNSHINYSKLDRLIVDEGPLSWIAMLAERQQEKV